jgi:hypothetical protein
MRARVCTRASSAVLFGRKPRAAVGLRWMAHDHWTEFQPRQEETFPAQAQVATWSMGRAEREWAGGSVSVSGLMAAWQAEHGLRASGPFSASSCFAAWREECILRERAVGHFPFSGRIS